MTSEEPPPTSTTATFPSTGWLRDLVAPMNAKRPSSSSSRTSTSTPAISSISSTTLSRFLASRIAAVATVLTVSAPISSASRSEEHTSELQSRPHLVCRLLLEKKNDPRYDHGDNQQSGNCRF